MLARHAQVNQPKAHALNSAARNKKCVQAMRAGTASTSTGGHLAPSTSTGGCPGKRHAPTESLPHCTDPLSPLKNCWRKKGVGGWENGGCALEPKMASCTCPPPPPRKNALLRLTLHVNCDKKICTYLLYHFFIMIMMKQSMYISLVS